MATPHVGSPSDKVDKVVEARWKRGDVMHRTNTQRKSLCLVGMNTKEQTKLKKCREREQQKGHNCGVSLVTSVNMQETLEGDFFYISSKI